MARKKKKKTPRYDFSNGFQKKILGMMVLSPTFLSEHSDAINPRFFETPEYGTLARLVLDYYEQYKKRPTKTALRSLISRHIRKSEMDREGADDINELSRDLFKVDLKDSDYIKDSVVRFAKFQSLKGGIMEVVKLLEKSESAKDLDKATGIIQKSLSVGESADLGLQLFDYMKSPKKLLTADKQRMPSRRIATGIAGIDNALGGGLGVGEIGVLLGASGKGKSMGLVNFAASAIVAGKRVVYITLELKPVDVSARILSRWSGIPTQSLFAKPKLLKEKLRKFNKIGSKYLRIKYFPPGQLTPQGLWAYLSRLVAVDEVKPDLLVIDYADEMIPTGGSGGDDSYQTYGYIYSDLINIGEEFGAAVWTASQVNREGYEAEVVEDRTVSDSLKKIQKADVAISLNQTAEEHKRNKMRLFMIKNRRGRKRVFVKCKFSPETATIKEV